MLNHAHPGMRTQTHTGVSGPVIFDKYGDLVHTDKSYVYIEHDPATGKPALRGFVNS
jgi:hypothetical protein